MEQFEERNLKAFSAEPLLVFPTHYTGDAGYISDTETSVVWDNEKVRTDWDRARSGKTQEQAEISSEAQNSDVLQSPLDSTATRDELWEEKGWRGRGWDWRWRDMLKIKNHREWCEPPRFFFVSLFYVLAPFLCIIAATWRIVCRGLFLFPFLTKDYKLKGLVAFFWKKIIPFPFSFQKYVGLTFFLLLHLQDPNTGWDLYVNSDLVGLSITFQWCDWPVNWNFVSDWSLPCLKCLIA